MVNKSAKLVDAEAIGFDEVDNEWISLHLAGEKFVMDLDTLIDLSFRCASFLDYVENKQENSLLISDAHCGCVSTNYNVH